MKYDMLLLWVGSLLGGLALCGARLGWFLFGNSPYPPAEQEALAMWRMKRRWLILSELSALPAFASIAVVAGNIYNWPVWGTVAFSMALGGLGFAFFLDALQTIVRKRLGMSDGERDNAKP